MKSAPVHFIREFEIRSQVEETFEELRKTLAGALPDARSFSSFTDDAREVPVGVQLVLAGSREDVFIRWRELLRRSPELLTAYNALKSSWHGRSHAEYRAEKGRFIEAALWQTGGTTLE